MILRPHQRKRNQCIMNLQQSISIVGKHHPENLRGEVSHVAAPRDDQTSSKSALGKSSDKPVLSGVYRMARSIVMDAIYQRQ